MMLFLRSNWCVLWKPVRCVSEAYVGVVVVVAGQERHSFGQVHVNYYLPAACLQIGRRRRL